MIKFFRHIRKSLIQENKMGKYFKYAIGEILLVVIGILIALQINNWNEYRKDRIAEQIYLKRLLKEFQSDSRGLNSIITISETSTENAKTNLEHLSTQEIIDTALFVKNAFMIGTKLIRRSYIPTYDELISSGKFSILQNDTLKGKLRSYMGIFEWWENAGDYAEIQSLFKDYNDHMHQYFSPLIMNEFGKNKMMFSDEVIPVEKLKSIGMDWNGYLSDQRSIYHLRKGTFMHEQLNILYKNNYEKKLLPLIELIQSEISE